MTDKEKLDAIRAEILRLVDVRGYNREMANDLLAFMDSLPNEPAEIDFEQELYNYFGQVKDFTLGMRIAKRFYDMGKNSQEPVSEDLEEAAKSYGKSIVQQACDELMKEYGGEYTPGEDNVLLVAKYFKAGAQWQKEKDESCSKDLGEYINELSKQFPEMSFAKLSRIAVRVAKWQEKQDQSTIELAEDHAMLAGMEKMKEEMMAKAIEGGCFSYRNGFVHISCDIDEHITNIKLGEKVKVIVIKENVI